MVANMKKDGAKLKPSTHVKKVVASGKKTMRSTAPAGLKPAATVIKASKRKPVMQGGSTGNIKVSGKGGAQTGGKGRAKTNAR
jgi:hypothetical protein